MSNEINKPTWLFALNCNMASFSSINVCWQVNKHLICYTADRETNQILCCDTILGFISVLVKFKIVIFPDYHFLKENSLRYVFRILNKPEGTTNYYLLLVPSIVFRHSHYLLTTVPTNLMWKIHDKYQLINSHVHF